MNSFSFYKNYYELIKYLSDEDRLELYDSIFNYMFEDKEPNFSELKKGIWINLKMPLDTSKNNSGRGGRIKKGETDSKPIENRLKTDLKPKRNRKETEKETNNNFLFLISNFLFLKDRGLLRGKIEEWLEYKKQRKEKYTEKGFNSLLKQIQNNCEKYGEENVINLIDECMANNYKGIIFDKLKKQSKVLQERDVPKWFNQDLGRGGFEDDEEGF